MTIDLTNPALFGIGDMLTSAQMNAFDANATNALDKRDGETDTLGAVVTLTLAGRIIERFANGPDADTAWTVSDPNGIVSVTGAISADRNYTLLHANAVAGDRVRFFCSAGIGFLVNIYDEAGINPFYLLGGEQVRLARGQFCEAVFNGATWMLMHGDQSATEHEEVFTSSGSWLCPDGVYEVELDGYGGGGGGAGGSVVTNGSAKFPVGGGGGAGSWRQTRKRAVSPGFSYAFTIGAAGGSGAAGSDGGNGGDTVFDAGGTEDVFPGGSGGVCANSFTTVNTNFLIAYGGVPFTDSPAMRQTFGRTFFASGSSATIPVPQLPGCGGWGGQNVITAIQGCGSLQGYSGGSPGTAGIDSGIYGGGGSGGGGGAGPGGNGGNGGNGGTANTVGGNTGGSGSAGANGGANTGAGAGGGGCAGMGSSAKGTDQAGGTGGAGRLKLTYVK